MHENKEVLLYNLKGMTITFVSEVD